MSQKVLTTPAAEWYRWKNVGGGKGNSWTVMFEGSADGTSFLSPSNLSFHPTPICTIYFPKIQYNISLRLLGLSSWHFSTSFPTNSPCAFVVFPSQMLAAEPTLASNILFILTSRGWCTFRRFLSGSIRNCLLISYFSCPNISSSNICQHLLFIPFPQIKKPRFKVILFKGKVTP